jgi:hypothetical protein
VADHAIDGHEITGESIMSEMSENAADDFKFGAAGFGVGKFFGSVGQKFFSPPHTYIAKMLNPKSTQKIFIGIGLTVSHSASNSEYLNCVHDTCQE